MTTIIGRVVWFNNVKGFGFIRHSGGEIFVHYSAIQVDGFKGLKEDEVVEFEIGAGPGGKPQAQNVTVQRWQREQKIVTQA